jgi:hypothetical protein
MEQGGTPFLQNYKYRTVVGMTHVVIGPIAGAL